MYTHIYIYLSYRHTYVFQHIPPQTCLFPSLGTTFPSWVPGQGGSPKTFQFFPCRPSSSPNDGFFCFFGFFFWETPCFFSHGQHVRTTVMISTGHHFFLVANTSQSWEMSKSQQGSSSEDVQSLIIFLPKNLGLARQRRLQQLQAEGLLEVYSKKTQQPTRLSDCSECWNVILVCHAKKSEVHVRICIYIYIYRVYVYKNIFSISCGYKHMFHN